jgi:hypothetical protein
MKGFLKTTVVLIITLNLMVGTYNGYKFAISNEVPSNRPTTFNGRNLLRESLVYLQCPGHQILSVEHGIKIASNATGIGEMLIASLLYTESGFRVSATSPKGYRGIAQTPTATMKYAEVDILHGAFILQDKLRITNGNMFRALSLYKGGNNPVAQKQAKQVLQVYNEVMRAIG